MLKHLNVVQRSPQAIKTSSQSHHRTIPIAEIRLIHRFNPEFLADLKHWQIQPGFILKLVKSHPGIHPGTSKKGNSRAGWIFLDTLRFSVKIQIEHFRRGAKWRLDIASICDWIFSDFPVFSGFSSGFLPGYEIKSIHNAQTIVLVSSRKAQTQMWHDSC